MFYPTCYLSKIKVLSSISDSILFLHANSGPRLLPAVSAGQDGDRKGNYVYDFLVKPLLASILILERTELSGSKRWTVSTRSSYLADIYWNCLSCCDAEITRC